MFTVAPGEVCVCNSICDACHSGGFLMGFGTCARISQALYIYLYTMTTLGGCLKGLARLFPWDSPGFTFYIYYDWMTFFARFETMS